MTLTKKEKIRRLVESALMLALSTLLAEFAIIKFPFGGSVTIFSQVPMVVMGVFSSWDTFATNSSR